MPGRNLTLNKTEPGQQPREVRKLFQQLRRRGFQLGIDDYLALRDAVWAGFGLLSRDDLRDVCCLLWAKSPREREILTALFERLELPVWNILQQGAGQDTQQDTSSDTPVETKTEVAPTSHIQGALPPISLDEKELPKRSFVLAPLLPLTHREIAQAWRRLRRLIHQGPLTEIDVEATVAQRSRSGVTTPIVLKPRLRNISRLLLLVDRQGSMAPFHRLCEELSMATWRTGKLEHVACYYFHNLPVESANEEVLEAVAGSFFPRLDSILAQIEPASGGYVYTDPGFFSPQPLEEVLHAHATDAAVVIVSDAGAARGYYNTSRLLDTIAFLKTLRTYTSYVVWLNPLPDERWKKSTAEQIARYVPMFLLARTGLYHAVNVLRGQPAAIERPL